MNFGKQFVLFSAVTFLVFSGDGSRLRYHAGSWSLSA